MTSESSEGTTSPPPGVEPLTRADLAALHERLDRLEQMLTTQQELAAQVPGILATLVNTADDVIARSKLGGDELTQRAIALLDLIEQITSPDILEALSRTFEDSGRVVDALHAAQSVPHVIAMGANVFDEVMGQLVERGFDIEALRERSAQNITAMISLLQNEHLATLLDGRLIAFAAMASKALTRTLQEDASRPHSPPVLWNLLRATRSEHVRKSVDLGVHFAARLGSKLGTSHALLSGRRPATTSSMEKKS